MSETDVTESRYKHLLAPIRDMAENWNIDIATELEEYLGELESITFSFDNGSTNLNFAEAALMIQGFTCVYSRKVEYLYNLLYSALEHVMLKKKNAAREKSSINADGVDMDAVFNDSNFLLPLDDHIHEGKNIDMDNSNPKDYDTIRKGTLMNRPPLALQNDVSDDNKRYKVSECLVHSSGALLFSEKEKSYLDGTARLGMEAHIAELPFGSPRALMSPAAMNMRQAKTNPNGSPQNIEYEDMGADGFSDDDDDDNGFQVNNEDIQASWNEEEALRNEAANAGGHGLAPVPEYEDEQGGAEDEVDMWAMEDPHDVSAAKPKPFKKGKTFKIPDASKSTCAVHTVRDFIDVVYHNPVHKALQQSIAKASCKAPYFSEFSATFVSHLKQERSSERAQAKAAQEQERRANAFSQRAAQLGPQDDDSDYEADDFDMGGASDDDMEANEWDVGGSSSSSSSSSSMDAVMQLTQTYEDLCKQHIEAYMSHADKYLQETQLSRRVRQWQDKLEPKLEEEAQHTAFDIHSYGSDLLTRLADEKDEKEEEEKELDFKELVADQPRYEVCRYFLAALQLANTHNVEISRSWLGEEVDQEVDELADALNGSLKLKFLSFGSAKEQITGFQVPVSMAQQEQEAKQRAPAAKKKATAAPQAKKQKKVQGASVLGDVTLAEANQNKANKRARTSSKAEKAAQVLPEPENARPNNGRVTRRSTRLSTS